MSVDPLPDWLVNLCVIPKPLLRSALPAIRYKNVIKKLDVWFDPDKSFDLLYKHEKTAFWLDSAKEIPGRGEFSYMGSIQSELG